MRLEARPPTPDGPAAITLEQLVRTALRLRPDRLVVGEVRGPEVLALVQALNTGHDGSWSTCHANSALDAVHRLETLVLQAAPSWPLAAARQHLGRSIDVVVHVARTGRLARRVVEIGEVVSGRRARAATARRRRRGRRSPAPGAGMTTASSHRRLVAAAVGLTVARGGRHLAASRYVDVAAVEVASPVAPRLAMAPGRRSARRRRGRRVVRAGRRCVAWRSLADGGRSSTPTTLGGRPVLPTVTHALRRGRGLADALDSMAGRPIDATGLVVPVLAASAHMGGPAASAMDRVAVTLQARDAERAERRTPARRPASRPAC